MATDKSQGQELSLGRNKGHPIQGKKSQRGIADQSANEIIANLEIIEAKLAERLLTKSRSVESGTSGLGDPSH